MINLHGRHLVVRRPGYTHHGIGYQRTGVIHYAGFDRKFKKAEVAEVPLAAFAGGGEVYWVHTPDRLYNRVQAVIRARGRVGEDDYNLVINNCEHFVNWCIYGRNKSRQVRRKLAIVAPPSALFGDPDDVFGGDEWELVYPAS